MGSEVFEVPLFRRPVPGVFGLERGFVTDVGVYGEKQLIGQLNRPQPEPCHFACQGRQGMRFQQTG